MEQDKLIEYNESKRREAVREQQQHFADRTVRAVLDVKMKTDLSEIMKDRMEIAQKLNTLPLHGQYDDKRKELVNIMKKHNNLLRQMLVLDVV